MPIQNMQDLKIALMVKMDTWQATQATREHILAENIKILDLGSIDIKPDYQLTGKNIDLNELGELGRILSILDLMQENQTEWGNAAFRLMVQRGCELALTLMERTKTPEHRGIFATQHGYKLTLCSNVDYYLEFVKLLHDDDKFSFILLSDKKIKERFEQLPEANDVFTIAANFRAIHYLPTQKQREDYIKNFIQLARKVNLTWTKTFAPGKKIPPTILQASPRADYLIDLLAIIPDAGRLTYAQQLVVSFCSRTEYRPPHLNALELILSYLTNDRDKRNFVTYFKGNIPLMGDDLEKGKHHPTNAIIREIFNNPSCRSFFEIQQSTLKQIDPPQALIDELIAQTAKYPSDAVSLARDKRLNAFMDDLEKSLSADMPQGSIFINSLEYLECILKAIQEKDKHSVRWDGLLAWFAERAAFLYVAKLSQLPLEQRVDYAREHMSNLVWTDMRFTLQVIELLRHIPNAAADFLMDSSLLPDTELANCSNIETIIGLMTTIPLLASEDERLGIKELLKAKIGVDPDTGRNKIDWPAIAQGRFSRNYYNPNYMVGVLFVMDDPQIRLASAHELIEKTIDPHGNCFADRMSLPSLAIILKACADVDPTQRKDLVEHYIQRNYLKPKEIVEAYALLTHKPGQQASDMPAPTKQMNSLASYDIAGEQGNTISPRMIQLLEKFTEFANLHAPIQVSVAIDGNKNIHVIFSIQPGEAVTQRLMTATHDWFVQSLSFVTQKIQLNINCTRNNHTHTFQIPAAQMVSLFQACHIGLPDTPISDADYLKRAPAPVSSIHQESNKAITAYMAPIQAFEQFCSTQGVFNRGCQIAFVTTADLTERADCREHYGLWFQIPHQLSQVLLQKMHTFHPQLFTEEIETTQTTKSSFFSPAKSRQVKNTVYWLFISEADIAYHREYSSKFQTTVKPDLTRIQPAPAPAFQASASDAYTAF